VQVPLAVLPDGGEDAVGDAAVSLLEGERRGLAKPVVLEAGERTRGGLGGRPVDDAGLDSPLVRAGPQVDVRRRNHRVARGEKGRVSPGRGVEYRLRVPLDARAVADLDVDAVSFFEGVDGRPDETAGIELRERAVGVPQGVPPLQCDGTLVVQPEPDEREHTPVSGRWRVKRLVRVHPSLSDQPLVNQTSGTIYVHNCGNYFRTTL